MGEVTSRKGQNACGAEDKRNRTLGQDWRMPRRLAHLLHPCPWIAALFAAPCPSIALLRRWLWCQWWLGGDQVAILFRHLHCIADISHHRHCRRSILFTVYGSVLFTGIYDAVAHQKWKKSGMGTCFQSFYLSKKQMALSWRRSSPVVVF